LRDLILLAALCGLAPLILRAPFVGLLIWIWLTIMNPHQEVQGFLMGAPLNICFTILTVGAWVGSRERKALPGNAYTIMLLVFAGWSSVCTLLALDREHSVPLWDRNMKTIMLALAVAILVNTRARLQAVIWVLVLSLGYFGLKGGLFVLLTGGRDHVWGPQFSMIADNNALGLALVVLLPILLFLRSTSTRAPVRWGLVLLFVFTIVAILGTYSRGALIALVTVTAFSSIRSRYGVLIALVAAIVIPALPAVMPSAWLDRMSTIKTANADTSFNERRAAWRTSFNIAVDRPFIGGGFAAVEQTWIARNHMSEGSLKGGRAAHSIYFEVLGDTGFLGLALYFMGIMAAGVNTIRVLALVRGRAALKWAGQLAHAFQVSILAFLTGGAALSMAYYDGFILIFILTAVLLKLTQDAVALEASGRAPEIDSGPKVRSWRGPAEPAVQSVL
jgi:probable O-glycosylation ligase (exosortase A-associated)